MSRIGRLPVEIPNKVKVSIKNGTYINVEGPLGKLEKKFPPVIELKEEGNSIIVVKKSENKFAKSMYGTARAVVNNMIIGVSKGFVKQLQLEGVGYRAEIAGKILKLALGYSHPIEFQIPENIEIKVERNLISIKGFDKELVGSVAAKIRSFRKPEPYKGKGIRYVDEKIIRKAGKTAK
jgi:large subunit ribosomal protein L6